MRSWRFIAWRRKAVGSRQKAERAGEMADLDPQTLQEESTRCDSPSGSAVAQYSVVFLSAFLLFWVQLLLGKYILPWFGGTPAVWTTCMLFFQVGLLAGYTYAHVIVSRLGPRAQGLLHAGLLLAGVLLLAWLTMEWGSPITPGANWKPRTSDQPVWHIIALLSASVGLPYFILSSTGPLVQAWFGRTASRPLSVPALRPFELWLVSGPAQLPVSA